MALKKDKVKVTLTKVFKQFGIEVYPKLYEHLAAAFVEEYESKAEVTDDTALLAVVIYEQRKKHHYRQTILKPITAGTVEYKALEKLVSIVNQFCEKYGYQYKKEGYTDYVEAAIILMGRNYSINRFAYYSEQIIQNREAKYMCESVTSPLPQQLHSVWQELAAKEYGATINISQTDYKKWVNFIYILDDMDIAKIPLTPKYFEQWCMAQIEGLRWMAKLPDLHQLHGAPALERYRAYTPKKVNAESDEAKRLRKILESKNKAK
jgi:hypothetical protein